MPVIEKPINRQQSIEHCMQWNSLASFIAYMQLNHKIITGLFDIQLTTGRNHLTIMSYCNNKFLHFSNSCCCLLFH